MGTLTIRVDDKFERRLNKLARRTGKSRSELVRDALRAYEVRATLDAVRRELVPKAQAAGWLTDEDVFRDVS